MKLGKFARIAGGITFCALVYIYMQMQIIDLAYQNTQKENQIRTYIEENGYIAYSISKLKSANHLGVKMLAKDSDMRFADPRNIIQVATSENGFDNEFMDQPDKISKKFSSLLSLLTSGTQAEARAQE